MIRSTARFGRKYALAKYDALRTAAEDAAIFGRALKSNSVRIRLYIDSYREYQKRLDTIMLYRKSDYPEYIKESQ